VCLLLAAPWLVSVFKKSPAKRIVACGYSEKKGKQRLDPLSAVQDSANTSKKEMTFTESGDLIINRASDRARGYNGR
jgi:hypothetical protein